MDGVKKHIVDADVVDRYRARYHRQDMIFRQFDRLVGALTGWKAARPPADASVPKRILLVNAGHLGDVIMSTSLLPVLHHAFPGVELGFLSGTYSRAIIEGHPLICRCHFIDHWYQSRNTVPRWRRFLIYLRTIPATVRELRAWRYDIAIDVRVWFPNFVPLLWMARIPIRIAYNRLGFAFLLTHSMDYSYQRSHEVAYQTALLRHLNISDASLAEAWPTLAPPTDAAVREARSLIDKRTRYRVLHPMASTSTRDWGLGKWQKLAQNLLASGVVPVVTGSGKRDKAAADRICAAAPGTISAVDALSWAGLIALLDRAEAVYAVETSVGHAASALRRPVISVYGGMSDPVHWAPLGAVVATNLMACHPCLIKAGCANRECLSGITVANVQAAAEIALANRPSAPQQPVNVNDHD